MPFDDELLDRFARLRDGDVERAPNWRSLVARGPIDRRPTPVRRAGAAVIAAGVLIGGGVVARRALTERGPVLSMSGWQSPTASLVPTTEQSVLAPAPLLSSVLDGATTSTLWKKGD